MRKFLIALTMIIAAPVLAEEVTQGATLGTTMDEVKASLTEMGYDVRKVEMEDGKIEAYAVMGSKMSEIYVDAASGEVTKIDDN
ncbi:PepSY domain-containing protein [Roseovarius sp. S1116L3]|uniref:PepSY domain-containing protein n=1 Tax=Roseovarius roseus TaxID=3342636 RepID=UPI0037267433